MYMYLAIQAQAPVAGLAAWQFLVAVAIGPLATIAVVLWTYRMNDRRGERRAEQVKEELGKRIDDLKGELGKRIEDLATRVTEVKTDLRGDLTAQTSQIRTDVAAVESHLKELMHSEVKAQSAELRAEIVNAHRDIIARLPAMSKTESAS